MRPWQQYPNLPLVTLAVVIILLLATAGYGLLRWWRFDQNLPKVGFRLQFAWLLTGVFILAMLVGRISLLLVIGFISFLALKEFLSITPTRRADRRVLFFAYLAIPIQFVLIGQGWYEAFLAFNPLYVFFLLALLMSVVGETQGFLKAYSSLNWGMLLTVYSPGHLAYLLMLPPESNPAGGGLGLFAFLVIVTQLSDLTQFVCGKLFAHPRLRLRVSTTRNWASLVGGMGTAALVAWLAAPLLTPLTAMEAPFIGAILAAAGFTGYVIMSAIKSDLQLKDRGSMTPGQGGVLNRIDSLIFTAPLFFYILVYLHFEL